MVVVVQESQYVRGDQSVVVVYYFVLFLQMSATMFGIIGGPMLGLFTLGILTKTANTKVNTFNKEHIFRQIAKTAKSM